MTVNNPVFDTLDEAIEYLKANHLKQINNKFVITFTQNKKLLDLVDELAQRLKDLGFPKLIIGGQPFGMSVRDIATRIRDYQRKYSRDNLSVIEKVLTIYISGVKKLVDNSQDTGRVKTLKYFIYRQEGNSLESPLDYYYENGIETSSKPADYISKIT